METGGVTFLHYKLRGQERSFYLSVSGFIKESSWDAICRPKQGVLEGERRSVAENSIGRETSAVVRYYTNQ